MKFLLPQGIGDSVWAMHKIQSVSKKIGDGRIEVYLNCSEESKVETRALDFIRRFDFVDEAHMLPGISIHPLLDPHVDDDGRYVYIPDGPTEFNGETYYALMPNGHLERGNRLETWLPEFEINWNLMDHFKITSEERQVGEDLKHWVGDYIVFYPGPMDGNLFSGHNRGEMWSPEDWINLGKRLHEELGVHIVVVGAPYDSEYYDSMLEPLLKERSIDYWTSVLGKTNIGELYGVTTKSRFIISYQSGVGIVSSYLGVPTGIFWRPKGNSINTYVYISFEEEMASAWTNPAMIAAGKHMPLIYWRHDVNYIVDEVKKRGW